jgi:RNA recognition motif-containing protein
MFGSISSQFLRVRDINILL